MISPFENKKASKQTCSEDDKNRGTTPVTAKRQSPYTDSNKPDALITGQAVMSYCKGFGHSAPERVCIVLLYRLPPTVGSLC